MLIVYAIIFQMKTCISFIFLFFFISLANAQTLVILGTTQDAGKPQIGCQKNCCKNLKDRFFVSSLGVTDTKNKKNYLSFTVLNIDNYISNFQNITLLF